MSKNAIAYLSIFVIIFGVVTTWNYTIRKPQINTAIAFLESLKRRDAEALKRVTKLSVYPVYKELYLRNGYNKHLLSYGELKEKDANNHFFPTQSRFGVRLEEDDMIFGKRTCDYIISLQKEQGEWKVRQFVTPGDYSDLEVLKRFIKPTEPEPQPEG
jgi:hypothetical protein